MEKPLQQASLISQINQLAKSCCSKMSYKERKEFFHYQDRVRKEGKCVKKKYVVGNTYYKGERKGELKEVFEVDGEKFNQLWELLHNYAAVAVMNSHLSIDKDDLECLVSGIKAQVFYVLRFFGGNPYGKDFAFMYRTIVTNQLTTLSRRRGRASGYGTGDSTRTLFSSQSISAPIGHGEDGDITLEDKLPCNHFVNTIDLQLDIPKELRKSVELLIGGLSVAEVARRRGYKTSAGIQKFRSVLKEKLAPVLLPQHK
jgi:hypothetical protein